MTVPKNGVGISTKPSDGVLVYDAPEVKGVADDDPEGYIPEDLLLNGIEVVVPIWPEQSPDGRVDTLIVKLTRNGVAEFTSTTSYTTPINELEFIIPIGPQYLLNDGVVEVSYETRNFVNNPHPSLPRKLTIDHTPIPKDLPEVTFPHASKAGYLICSTDPPIWEGVHVEVPPLPTFCKIGDVCVVEWMGYDSLNGSGPPISRTHKLIPKEIRSQQEIDAGFSVTVLPYRPHIEPIVFGSAVVSYTLRRGARIIGVSMEDFVKIDRIRSGEQPCGPE